MRIAVTYENGEVFQHFGHTEQFKFYDVEDGKIVAEQIVPTNGSGHGALAAGTLSYDPNAKCDHHGHHHGEGHDCGHRRGKGLDCGHQEGDEGCRRHHGN